MKFASLADLAKSGAKVVLAAATVPVGGYARQTFGKLSGTAGYPADFPAAVEKNVVSNELDVKAVVTKISLGEGDAGVVYSTDVTSTVAPKLDVLAFPSSVAPDIEYPLAALKNAPERQGRASLRRLRALARRSGVPQSARVHLTVMRRPAAILALAVMLAAGLAAGAQTPPAAHGTPAPPPAPFHIVLSPATLAGFPRVTISATDEAGHTNKYTGVSLHDVLVKAGAPTGAPVRALAMLSYVLISAADNYHVIFALPELDPSYTDHVAVIAESVDGVPFKDAGPYRLIVPFEKRQARWVKNMTAVATCPASGRSPDGIPPRRGATGSHHVGRARRRERSGPRPYAVLRSARRVRHEAAIAVEIFIDPLRVGCEVTDERGPILPA